MRGCSKGGDREVAQKINSQLYRNNNCGGSSSSGSRRKQRTRVKEKQKKNT